MQIDGLYPSKCSKGILIAVENLMQWVVLITARLACRQILMKIMGSVQREQGSNMVRSSLKRSADFRP